MDDDQTVTLTLVELSLFLVFSILFLWITEAHPEESVEDIDEIKRELELTKNRLSSLEQENEILKENLKKLEAQQDKLSTRKPGCDEPDFGRQDYLFTAVVYGKDKFEIGGNLLRFDQIEERFREQNARAERLGCVHLIRLAFRKGLDADTYHVARQRLGRRYYPKPVGPVSE